MKKKILSLCFTTIFALSVLTPGNLSKISTAFSNQTIVVSAATASPKVIRDAVKKALGSDYIQNPTKLSETELKEQLGVSKEFYSSIYAERPMIGNDCLVIIKVKSGKVNTVKGKLETYKKKLMNDLYQSSSNHSNEAKIYSNGNYVCFLMISDNNTALKAIKKALK